MNDLTNDIKREATRHHDARLALIDELIASAEASGNIMMAEHCRATKEAYLRAALGFGVSK